MGYWFVFCFVRKSYTGVGTWLNFLLTTHWSVHSCFSRTVASSAEQSIMLLPKPKHSGPVFNIFFLQTISKCSEEGNIWVSRRDELCLVYVFMVKCKDRIDLVFHLFPFLRWNSDTRGRFWWSSRLGVLTESDFWGQRNCAMTSWMHYCFLFCRHRLHPLPDFP